MSRTDEAHILSMSHVTMSHVTMSHVTMSHVTMSHVTSSARYEKLLLLSHVSYGCIDTLSLSLSFSLALFLSRSLSVYLSLQSPLPSSLSLHFSLIFSISRSQSLSSSVSLPTPPLPLSLCPPLSSPPTPLIAGATITAICSDRNSEFVRSLGADRVIDYSRVRCCELQYKRIHTPMYIYVCTCTSIQMKKYKCIRTCTFVHIYTHKYRSTYMYTRTSIHM